MPPTLSRRKFTISFVLPLHSVSHPVSQKVCLIGKQLAYQVIQKPHILHDLGYAELLEQ